MADASIPVDLFNPGQVFACLGFLEAADILLGDAEGGFDWSGNIAAQFLMHAAGAENPIEAVLGFLRSADVKSLAPFGSSHRTKKWDVETIALSQEDPFPFPDPASPATLPAELTAARRSIWIDHWGDETVRDNVKFWAGSGGYPGAALTSDAIELIRQLPRDCWHDPFNASAPQSSSFRFDWRRDYVPMNVGFSPNEHGTMTMLGFPVVEVMAAIGLTHARPKRLTKLDYRYGVLGLDGSQSLLPLTLMRAALGCADFPFRNRRFRMTLDWPGQENQARCITTVIEERTDDPLDA
jgi:CRISPR-associated protein Csx14